jgi:serine/threonine-protein kinase
MTAVLDGRYRLVAPIGRGGMSVVWRGHDDLLSRPVAVKVINTTDTSFAEHVRREATAIARLSHPHIATVYDYGLDAARGTPYIVMELVDGESLAQVLRRGPLSWPTALGILTQVAAALATAHAHDVVHRDITPANVMLCADGAKVIDFGIAAGAGEDNDRLIFGTPAYLAPERVSGGPALPATDVYGLGLLGYEALTGHRPWPAATVTEMVAAHRHVPPEPLPLIEGLPPEARRILHDCLAVDPAARPSSFAVFQALAPLARAGDPRRVGPHGTRVLAHPGVVRSGDANAATVDVTRARARVGRERPRPALSFLPTILLALLVGGLGVASVRSGGDFSSDKPATRPTAPTVIAAPPDGPAGAHRAPRMPPRASCHVDFAMTSQWGFGFTAQMSLENRGTVPINGWELRFRLAHGLRVGGGWNGRWSQTGNVVTVRDVPYNATVPPGGTVTLGFLGTAAHGGIAAPTRFTVNGVACR